MVRVGIEEPQVRVAARPACHVFARRATRCGRYARHAFGARVESLRKRIAMSFPVRAATPPVEYPRCRSPVIHQPAPSQAKRREV